MWNWLKSFSSETSQMVPNNCYNNQSGPSTCKSDNKIVKGESPKRSDQKPILQDIPSYQEFKGALNKLNNPKKKNEVH